MAKLQKYLNENISKQILIENVMTHMGMSNSTFYRFIRNKTGVNFSTYLLEYRLNTVIRELNKTEIGNKISFESLIEHFGFMSLSYFYKAFKKKTGMTPLEYQKNHKQSLVRCI